MISRSCVVYIRSTLIGSGRIRELLEGTNVNAGVSRSHENVNTPLESKVDLDLVNGLSAVKNAMKTEIQN
jgi:hypothetical protein